MSLKEAYDVEVAMENRLNGQGRRRKGKALEKLHQPDARIKMPYLCEFKINLNIATFLVSHMV